MKVAGEMFNAFSKAQVPDGATPDQAVWAGIQAVLDLIEKAEAERTTKAVAELAAAQNGDPECAHGEADGVLLRYVPREVAAAWDALEKRCGGFWYA